MRCKIIYSIFWLNYCTTSNTVLCTSSLTYSTSITGISKETKKICQVWLSGTVDTPVPVIQSCPLSPISVLNLDTALDSSDNSLINIPITCTTMPKHHNSHCQWDAISSHVNLSPPPPPTVQWEDYSECHLGCPQSLRELFHEHKGQHSRQCQSHKNTWLLQKSTGQQLDLSKPFLLMWSHFQGLHDQISHMLASPQLGGRSLYSNSQFVTWSQTN